MASQTDRRPQMVVVATSEGDNSQIEIEVNVDLECRCGCAITEEVIHIHIRNEQYYCTYKFNVLTCLVAILKK